MADLCVDFAATAQGACRPSPLFVAIGASGAVYPAAGFVAQAGALGIATCEINLEPSDNAELFDEKRYGKASEMVPAWVEVIAGGIGGSSFRI
jgi:NAD-dependent deacetylase